MTGEPLWPIEERPVPKTDVPGEYSHPTQPFPTRPAAFARQSFTVDDVNPWRLTPEQYADMRARVAKARNGTGPQGGLFIPPAVEEDTISMPGNQGGSNWGTTAANPEKGLVFVVNVNQVALLKLEDVKTRAGSGNNQISGTLLQQGRAIYQQNCAACHGANLQSGIPGAPSLVGVTSRYDAESIRAIVSEGRGEMRPILSIGSNEMNALYAFLSATNPAGRGGRGGARGGGPGITYPPGPVVASGGAPRPPLPARGIGPYYPGIGGNAGNIPWPEEVDKSTLPPTRYMSGYNVLGAATKPPYATLTAYDLNTGEIKWQIAPGDDPLTVKAGGPTRTGMVGGRNGIVVTRTGLVFHAAGDGFMRAFDEDTGEELWKAPIPPGNPRGIPAMYMAGGRQYLLVMASGGGGGGATQQSPGADTPRGYIAFALPQR